MRTPLLLATLVGSTLLRAQPPAICDGLQAAFTTATTPNGTQFSNGTTGVGQQTNWYWTFGDGGTSTDAQPLHTYGSAGEYEVCLYAITIFYNGAPAPTTCVDTVCAVVQVGGADPCAELEACFVASQTGTNTIFFNNCTQPGTNTQYVWAFGDGSTGAGIAPTHTYGQSGTYSVCVKAYWNGCVDEFCMNVVVQGGPDPCAGLSANFTWSPTLGGTQFDGSATGTGQSTTWYWTFGDGTSGNTEDPFHTYVEPGAYDVCLYAISVYPNNNGGLLTCVDTACAIVVVQGGTNPCDGLSADFWFGNNGGDPASIFFSATTGNGPYWLWSFGDGTYSDNGPQGTHTYPEVGTYVICLTVWDVLPGTQDTCSVTTCQTVVIEGEDPCDAFVACFEANAIDNDGFVFQNCTQPNTSVQYIWHFGDGSTGTGVNPDHTYAEPGTYTVCLTAYWGTCVDEFCSTVVVQGGTDPCDQLAAGFVWTTSPNGIQFSNGTTGVGFSTTWYWTFGDGTTGTDPQPFHTYPGPGTYEACLQVISIFQLVGGNVVTCVDTACAIVVVQEGGPCDTFVACFEASAIDNDGFVFQNCTQPNTSVQYVWHFGDATTGTGVNPDHTYAEPGIYTVCLTAYWGTCVDEFCSTVVVQGGTDPCDQLAAGFVWTTSPSGIQFSNGTTGVGFSTTWYWTFGDGTTGTNPQPFHTYPGPGTYEACLQVISIFQLAGGNVVTCVDTACAIVVVQGGGDPCDGLVAGFTSTITPNGAQFFNSTTGTGFQTTWQWTFGDGGTSSDAQPFHTYQEPGTYEVCLVVVSQYETTGGVVSCSEEFCAPVLIGGIGCQPFEVGFSWTAQGNAVVFISTSSTAVNDVLWFFGDGTNGSGPIVTHLYEPPGPYDVCVAAWYWNNNTQDSCWAEHCESLDLFGVGVGGSEIERVSIYPIPAHGRLAIEGLRVTTGLYCYSADGRLVIQERASTDRYNLDIARLAPGTYLLELRSGDERSMRRFVVE